MSDLTPADISRRAFLTSGAFAIGSLFLPKVPGTDDSFIVPFAPESAWADELGAVGNIMVVGRKQIGIAVGDIGTLDPGAQSIRSLSGAKVTVHSYYNQREVTGRTDASGRVVFDIDRLAEANSLDSADPTDSNGKKLEYCFNGKITVTRDGYRDVVIPLMRIRSVSAIVIPSRVLNPGEPYLRQLSFDRWDLQYMKATFVSSSKNDADHTFAAEVWIPARKIVSMRLYATSTQKDGSISTKEIGSATFKGGSSNGCQSTTFKARYLCPNWSREELPTGCKVMVDLECDGTTTTVVSGMEIKAAPFVDKEDGQIDVVPETQGTGGIRLAKLPGGLPKPLGGSSFKLWTPSFEHVMYNFSPLGYLMIGLQLGSLKLTKDAGPFETAGWQRQTQQSAGQQFDKLCKKQSKELAKVGNMYTDAATGRRKAFASNCTKQVAIKGCFQVFAQLTYDWKTAVWAGDLNAVIGGGVEASWTVQMIIVFVPVYISFNLGAQITAGLKFAARTHGSSLDKLIGNAVYEADKSGAGFTFTISVGLTLGVGVANVLCAYIRGQGYITLSIAYQNSSNRDTARVRLGVGLEASLGVQVLLFSWSGKLWSQNWPGLYDSYNDARDAVVALANGGSMPLDENGIPQFTAEALRDQMSIVTQDMLRRSAEFSANNTAALFSNEDEQPLFVEPVDLGDDNLLWDVPLQPGLSKGSFDENGEPILGADEPEELYTYIGTNTHASVPDRDYLGTEDCLRAGIEGVSDDVFGGIKPSLDNVIFKNVFSDPRTKTFYSTMFRIGTVRYGDQTRTRIVYTSVNDGSWDNPSVIDFTPYFNNGSEAIDRMDMYDYDFALTYMSGNFGDYLYLMIISGTRPEGDNTTFAEANAKTVVSVVRLYNAYTAHNPWRCDRAICWQPAMGSNYVLSFSSPCISAYADRDHSLHETNSCVIGACLVNMANKDHPENLLTNGTNRILTFHITHKGKDEFKVLTRDTGFDRLNVPGATKLVMGPLTLDWIPAYNDYDPADRHVIVGAVGSNGAAFYRILVKMGGEWGPTIKTLFMTGMDESHDVQRLYSTGSDGEFYAVRTDKDLIAKSADEGTDTSYRRDGRLYLVNAYQGSAVYTPITPKDTCIPSELLVSKDGRYLFYMVNQEGISSRGFTDEGEVGPELSNEEQKANNSYNVMALARVGNLFTKPFTLASLDHPIDYMTSMMSWESTATLIGSQVTDPANSIADIYDIRIPLAAVATPLSIATEGPFAFAGEDTVFNVEVRNDGNTILKGATFNLYEVTLNADGSETVESDPACTANVDFQPGLVTYANGEEPDYPTYDVDELPEDLLSSPLVSAGELGLLVPGQIQSYKVTFHIPDSWSSSPAADGSTSSERRVRVKITAPRYLEFNADATSLLTDEPGEGNQSDIDYDVSNGDFEDLTPEEWQQFFNFLFLLMALYEEDDEDDWPETEISVLDGGLPLENISYLHDSENTDEPSDEPDKPSSNGNSNAKANGKTGQKYSGPQDKLPDTGDRNILTGLLTELQKD